MSAALEYVIEPWFLGGGAETPPGLEFKVWKDEVEGKYGTKFTKSINY